MGVLTIFDDSRLFPLTLFSFFVNDLLKVPFGDQSESNTLTLNSVVKCLTKYM